jgi:tetratricopeptide (TPR) repeat protein
MIISPDLISLVLVLFFNGSWTAEGKTLKLLRLLDDVVCIQIRAEPYKNNDGKQYFMSGETGLAIQNYNKAIELNPDEAVYYKNRGDVYKDLGELEQAIRDYNSSVNLDPGNSVTYHNRAVAYVELDQPKQAIRDFDKAIELDPYEAPYYFTWRVRASHSGFRQSY